jgi:hypothetical protein
MLVALAALAAPAGAQQQPPPDDIGIWDILKLPQTVEEGRRAGIPSGSIWGVLDSLRRRGVPASDAGQIVRDDIDAVKAGAPPENFGKYVNAQLARGLRGRELAAAIHAEHARRGIGQGRGKPQRAGAAAGRDRQDVPDTAKGKGRGRKP